MTDRNIQIQKQMLDLAVITPVRDSKKPSGEVSQGAFKLIDSKTGKELEQNKILETKQEVFDTIALKDYKKYTNTYPSIIFFNIKKGDPMQVIKTTQKGTLRNNVWYSLKKHNGKSYEMTEDEKLAIKSPFIKTGNFGLFSEYDLPKDVVQESVLIDKIESKLNRLTTRAYIIIGVVLVAGYLVYKKNNN